MRKAYRNGPLVRPPVNKIGIMPHGVPSCVINAVEVFSYVAQLSGIGQGNGNGYGTGAGSGGALINGGPHISCKMFDVEYSGGTIRNRADGNGHGQGHAGRGFGTGVGPYPNGTRLARMKYIAIVGNPATLKTPRITELVMHDSHT